MKGFPRRLLSEVGDAELPDALVTCHELLEGLRVPRVPSTIYKATTYPASSVGSELPEGPQKPHFKIGWMQGLCARAVSLGTGIHQPSTSNSFTIPNGTAPSNNPKPGKN